MWIENKETRNEFGLRVATLKYKEVISQCTSGNIRREDLISDWHIVKMESGEEVRAYHHKWFGWMERGLDVENKFIHGYRPLRNKVTHWR